MRQPVQPGFTSWFRSNSATQTTCLYRPPSGMIWFRPSAGFIRPVFKWIVHIAGPFHIHDRGPTGHRTSGRGNPARRAGLRNDGPLSLKREWIANARTTNWCGIISVNVSRWHPSGVARGCQRHLKAILPRRLPHLWAGAWSWCVFHYVAARRRRNPPAGRLRHLGAAKMPPAPASRIA